MALALWQVIRTRKRHERTQYPGCGGWANEKKRGGHPLSNDRGKKRHDTVGVLGSNATYTSPVTSQVISRQRYEPLSL